LAVFFGAKLMATSLSNTKTRFFDKCGKPLSGGEIYTYKVGSTEPKATYTDSKKTTPNTNPVQLDISGSAAIFLDGAYRVRVLSKSGVLIEDIPFTESWISESQKDDIYKSLGEVSSQLLGEINKKADTEYVDQQLLTVDEQLALKAPQETTYTKLEVDSALSAKAPQETTYTKAEVDTTFAAYVGGRKGFTTLALAQAGQSTLPADTVVDVTNDPDPAKNGTYQWNGTTLTKSAHDPLTQAKSYTDQKTALQIIGAIGKNLFDKSKATNGKGLGDTGAEITASTRSVSDFIPVLPNTAYSFTSTRKACFYDANKNFVQLVASSLENVTSSASAAFLRLDIDTVLLDAAQVEKGTIRTIYEPYGIVLKDDSISDKQIKNRSLSGSKLKSMSIAARHFDDATFLNMHNAATLRKGITLNLTNGYTETALANFDVTDFIPCQPNKTYTANEMSRVLFYAEDGTFISASADKTFTTPSNCYQLRFNLNAPVSFRFQLNEGTTTPSVVPQPYKFSLNQLYIPPQTKAELTTITARKYNLTDAWLAWRNGEKFPICFLGDSTTNGNGTTGFVPRVTPYDFTLDYVSPNSYPTVLQALIREATGNSVMRVYNAGFGGQSARWAAPQMDEIMGHAYADTKMLGISHGINDRTANLALYVSNFYRDIEAIIKWCLSKGIQPFLLTTQPTIIPEQTDSASGPEIDEVANNIKRELSQKWGLEIIDVNKFGQQFMQYSSKPLLNDIMEYGSNAIHFGDGGHKFTAELMFANFCKRTIWTEDGEQLDYTAQQLKSDIVFTDVKQIVPFKQGFKVELNTTQATAENKLLQDFWVFNAGRKQLSLTAYYANAATGQYVEVDGVQTTIASQGQALGSLDLGLHKIKAYSGATTQLDWLGFKLI
jgi:hypothetical protein